jgi:hypothetical protein
VHEARAVHVDFARAELGDFVGGASSGGGARKVAFVSAASLNDEVTYYLRMQANFAPRPPDGAGVQLLHLKWNDEPLATLARQRWLSSLGRAALGERLAAVPGIERGPLEFARLVAGDRLYHRALRERADPPASLWARRSWFAIAGDRLLVQEVFLPESHA